MCVEAIASKDFYCPDLAVMVLSNLTRSEAVAQSLVELHIGGEPAVRIAQSPSLPCRDVNICCYGQQAGRCRQERMQTAEVRVGPSFLQVHTLIDIFCRMKPHNEKGNFHHLALVIFNITQTPAGRSVIMSKKGQGTVGKATAFRHCASAFLDYCCPRRHSCLHGRN